jgi:hypothetical protein
MFALPDRSWIEPVMPLALGAAIYGALMIGYVAPEIVIPRLVERVYRPACMTGVERRAEMVAMEQAQRLRELSLISEQASDVMRDQTRAFAELFFPGSDLADDPTISRLIDGYAGLAGHAAALDAAKTAQQSNVPPPQYPSAAAWCTCAIDEALNDRLGTGLFVASWRIWKPRIVERLETQSERLLVSEGCGSAPV